MRPRPSEYNRDGKVGVYNIDQADTAVMHNVSVRSERIPYGIDQLDTVNMSSMAVNRERSLNIKQLKVTTTDIICIVLFICAFILWCFSLQHEDVSKMNDLGMISTFPPSFITSLVIVTISFCLALGYPQLRTPLLILHLVFIIFMLYGIQNIVEEAPRFAIVYRHAGYTEYIMRTGSVDPNLDAYFNWPGFFVLSALVTQLAGYHDILSYAGWTPVFYNLIYALPLYMLFTAATKDKRLVWLGLWFFYLTNWIGQDYFSPQGLNFFLYLVIIAMLLKWFNVSRVRWPRQISQWLSRLGGLSVPTQKMWVWVTAPDTHRTALQSRKRTALLIVMIVIFAFSVFSHPLTPFFVIASVTALAFFRRCDPWWLPLLMGAMITFWLLVMAHDFLVGHLSMVVGNVGQANSAVTTTVVSRVVGNPDHEFVATLRIIMSALIWLLACGGAIRRLRQGYHDITYILLAVVPFPLILVQQYGGEIFLRIYLFSLPLMAFFAAALFFHTHHLPIRRMLPWKTLAIICINLVLLGGFFFTRYGNERVDYMTYDEIAGFRYLYAVAPTHSLLLAGWEGSPWQFQDYEKYTCTSMDYALPDAVMTANADAIVQYINLQNYSHTYLIFSRSQGADATAYSGLPSNMLELLEAKIRKSRNFKLLYSNRDIQVFQFIK